LHIHVKRIYEPCAPHDGTRILVDRLWPRGIKKENARIDKWFKQVAPSDELRKWYNHDHEKFVVFSDKYQAELAKTPALDDLFDYIHQLDIVTLLYSSKEEQFNNASALKDIIISHLQ
jgi:uncharacterized protein YeaO (DUF488 family)